MLVDLHKNNYVIEINVRIRRSISLLGFFFVHSSHNLVSENIILRYPTLVFIRAKTITSSPHLDINEFF